jgi:hypothetical protein
MAFRQIAGLIHKSITNKKREPESPRLCLAGTDAKSGPIQLLKCVVFQAPSRASALNLCSPGWATFLKSKSLDLCGPQIENGLQLFVEDFNDHRTSHESISDSVRQYDFAADRAPARCALLRFKFRYSTANKLKFALELPKSASRSPRPPSRRPIRTLERISRISVIELRTSSTRVTSVTGPGSAEPGPFCLPRKVGPPRALKQSDPCQLLSPAPYRQRFSRPN